MGGHSWNPELGSRIFLRAFFRRSPKTPAISARLCRRFMPIPAIDARRLREFLTTPSISARFFRRFPTKIWEFSPKFRSNFRKSAVFLRAGRKFPHQNTHPRTTKTAHAQKLLPDFSTKRKKNAQNTTKSKKKAQKKPKKPRNHETTHKNHRRDARKQETARKAHKLENKLRTHRIA